MLELWIKTENKMELIGRYTDENELKLDLFELMLNGIEGKMIVIERLIYTEKKVA